MNKNETILGLSLSPNQELHIDLNDLEKRVLTIFNWEVKYFFENIDIQLTSDTDEGKMDVIIRPNGEVSCYMPVNSDYFSVTDLLMMWNMVECLVKELKIATEYENKIKIHIHSKNPEYSYNTSEKSIEGFIATVYAQSVNSIREQGISVKEAKFSLEIYKDKKNYITTIAPDSNSLLISKSLPFKRLLNSPLSNTLKSSKPNLLNKSEIIRNLNDI